MILIVRPELAALLAEQFGVCPEHGEGERVERQDVLRVLGLAVRLDDPAVHHDAGGLDGERSGVQVEQITASTRQLAPPHARRGFKYPQREEPVRPSALQKGLELGDVPDLAALARDAGRMRVIDEIPFCPPPHREVLPGPVQHAVRVDDRLGLQAGRHLIS